MKERCPHRPPCPGCPRFGEHEISAARHATLTRLAEAADATLLPVVTGPWRGWRHRARLRVAGRVNSPKIGIYQEGSHRLADIPHCPVHHPLINEIARQTRAAMRSTRTPPYVESIHGGLVRYLQVVVARSTGSAQVVLVCNSDAPEPVMPLAEALLATAGTAIDSLHWNVNPRRTNTILGPHWRNLHGSEFSTDRFGGATVYYPPGAFGQANANVFSRLVEFVHEQVQPFASVCDLYCGCGTIGLGLARRVDALYLNERSPHGLRGLERGVEDLPASHRCHLRILPGAAHEALAHVTGVECIIADPPRSGMSREVLEQLALQQQAHVITVNCGFDAFQREFEHLSRTRPVRLLAPFDLFPFTEHVEVVTVYGPALCAPRRHSLPSAP